MQVDYSRVLANKFLYRVVRPHKYNPIAFDSDGLRTRHTLIYRIDVTVFEDQVG